MRERAGERDELLRCWYLWSFHPRRLYCSQQPAAAAVLDPVALVLGDAKLCTLYALCVSLASGADPAPPDARARSWRRQWGLHRVELAATAATAASAAAAAAAAATAPLFSQFQPLARCPQAARPAVCVRRLLLLRLRRPLRKEAPRRARRRRTLCAAQRMQASKEAGKARLTLATAVPAPYYLHAICSANFARLTSSLYLSIYISLFLYLILY